MFGHMELFGLLEWLLSQRTTGMQPDYESVKGIRNEAELLAFIQSVLRPYLPAISILIGIADTSDMIAFWWGHMVSVPGLPARVDPLYLSGDSNILEVHAPDRKDAFQTSLYNNGFKEVLIQPLHVQGKPLGFLCLLSDKGEVFAGQVQELVAASAGVFASACLQVLLLLLVEEYQQKVDSTLPVMGSGRALIGGSALQPALMMVEQVAPTVATVLLTGETGTGKEVFARAIHDASPRRDMPMVKVNCAALPANLVESELFGHEKGAFTGALQRRIGKFEQADGGTLFLDEVGELPLELQAKLLRAIQEKEIERVGGNVTIQVDVRIIAATNRVLEEEVARGKFREDLYYRLHVFPIQLPALRERKEDIPALLQHFAARAGVRYGKVVKGIDARSLPALVNYSWPGNIRELENLVERAVITAKGPSIVVAAPVSRQFAATDVSPPVMSLAAAEKAAIIQALRLCNGRIRGPQGAAEVLEIKPTTLEARMKKLGIVKEHVIR
jgi:transcriptional regulator with GAF, ATPase, and Fis domain